MSAQSPARAVWQSPTACVRRAAPCRDSGHQVDSVRAARALASGEGRLTSPTPGCRRPWKIKNVYPGLANTGCKHTVLTMIACICEHIPLRTHPQRRLRCCRPERHTLSSSAYGRGRRTYNRTCPLEGLVIMRGTCTRTGSVHAMGKRQAPAPKRRYGGEPWTTVVLWTVS